MTSITIPLSDAGWQRLKDLAAQAGASPEEFLGQRVDELLTPTTDPAFEDAARHVFQKNAELYRRLA